MFKKIIIPILIIIVVIPLIIFMKNRIKENGIKQAAWDSLQKWAMTASPGDLLKNNIQLACKDGVEWEPLHYQDEEIKFLYSDSPEYLYNDSLGKAVSYMRLTDDDKYRINSKEQMKFGIGMYHINKTEDAMKQPIPNPVKIMVINRGTRNKNGNVLKNNANAEVELMKGAHGTTIGMPVYGGKECVFNWLSKPNVPTAKFTITPGKSQVIFTKMLPGDTGMNAKFDLVATNAYFLDVYIIFGDVKNNDKIAFAPYGITIGTNSGTGTYWKRKMLPEIGNLPFDPTNTNRNNKVHYRYMKYKVTADTQYLVDESWEMRPNNPGKELVISKGGKRRAFKGDYNVEYTITIPVITHGKPAQFAIIDTQRFGLYAGAAKTPDGNVVKLPNIANELIDFDPKGEGALIARPTITGNGVSEYSFTWALSGGSYGDQDFLLIPLGEKK